MRKNSIMKITISTAMAVVMSIAIWALYANAATVTDFYNDADPFPNTTSTDITVEYSASVSQDTQIELTFATSGEFVRRLYSGLPAAGTSFTFTWDARNDADQLMGPGTFIATVKTGVQFTYNTKIEGTGMIMSNPTDVYVDDTGNIYFVNVSNEVVEKINTSGTLLVKFDAGDDGASLTYGVAADSTGNIYVSDSSNNRIMKYDPNGQLLDANYICNGCTISQTLNDPRGLYIYADNLFVAEYGDSDINRFDLSTNTTVWQGKAVDDRAYDVAVGNLNGGGTPYVFVTVGPDNEINSFIYSSGASCGAAQDMQDDATLNGCTTPMGIDVNSRSNATHIYVTCLGEDKVFKYPLTDTTSLTSSYSFGTYGGGTDQLNDPSGVTMLVNTNYIFVADANNNRLSVLYDNGSSLAYDSLIEADEYNLFEPTDMAIDPAKYVYIASYQGNFVKKFTQSGLYVDTFGNTGSAAGQFDGIEGVEVYDSTGDGIADFIFAADAGNSRVQCYDVNNDAWNDNAPSACGAGWGTSGFAVDAPLGLGFDDVNGVVIVAKGTNPKAQIGINLDGTQAWTSSTAAIIDDNAADFNSNTFYTTSSSNQVRDSVDGNPKGKCWNGSTWKDTPPYGITLDDFGNVYITTDKGDGTCVHMTKMGRYYTTLLTSTSGGFEYVAGTGSYGTGDGQFLAPRGVTVDPDGTFVWVADRSNDRAQKFLITYTSTAQDNVTICENVAPTVNNILLSDPSPTQAGTVQFSIAFSSCGMQALYEPTAWFTTGDISPVSVQIYDEALILDTGSTPGEYDLTDTVILGRSPAVGTTLTSISASLKYVDSDASTTYTAGANPETICRDADSDNVCDVGEPRWGVTTDIGSALRAFSGSYAYPDYNGNAQFDGYFVNNEYKGFGVVPTGHDGIATIKVCGPSPTYTGPRSSGGLYMTVCDTSHTFQIDTSGPSVNINIDQLVTTETWTPAYGTTETDTDVTVAMTDFTCFAYDADGDSVVDAGENVLGCTVGTDPCCAVSDNLIPLLSREKHVEKTGGTSNRYDATEAVAYDNPSAGNIGYYDPGVDTLILCNGATTCAEPDSSGNCTAPCTAPVSGEPLVAFNSYEKVLRVSYQDVSTDSATETYYANHISMPAPVPGYKYFTAIATDESGNTGSWYQPRLRVKRIEFPPGRAEWRPTSYDMDETMNSKNSYTIRYTAASEFDSGVCGAAGSCTEDCYVTIDIPTGWDAPSSVSGSPGEVYIVPSASTTLCSTNYTLSSNKIKVLVSDMAAGAYVDVTYGYMGNGGPGAKIGTSSSVGQTPFVVKSCIACAGSEAEMDNPSVTVHPMPLKVSRTKKLGAGAKTVIYDNEVKADIMTLAFRNTNVSPNTAKVTTMKLKVLINGTAGPYYPDDVISKIYLYDGAGNLIVEDNSIESSGNTITLEDLSGNPITVSPGGTNGVELKVDFKCLSTSCSPNLQITSLEFLLDADSDYITGTTTAAMTETTITDSTKAWTTNNYSGYTLIPDLTKPTNTYVIAYNTGTVLTVRSTDLMVTDRGSSASGSSYAIGYESTSLNAYVSGTSMRITSDKTQSATFYPDDPTANSEMTSGKVTTFLPPPIAKGIYVRYDNTTWPNLANQKLTKGQTSTQPFKLKMRLIDTFLTASCSAGGTILTVTDGSMLTMGDAVVIGDLNSVSSDSTSYDETTVSSVIGNIVNISSGCSKAFNTSDKAYVIRQNALASVTGLDIKVEGDGIGTDPAPNGIISRKVLVGYADTTSIESTGSTISFDAFLDEVTGTPISLDALTFPKQLDFKVNILCSGSASNPQACPTGTNETKVKFSIPSTTYITVGDPAETSIYPNPWVTPESFTGTIQDQPWITALSVDRSEPDACPSEAGIGTSFEINVRVENPAAVGSFERAKGRMYSSSSDLKFTCTSGSCTPGGDYTSEFTVTPTSPTTASYASVNPGESATMTYSVVHTAASPTPGVYAIDVAYTGSVSTNKPQARDGNDYYDNDKLYVNRETDGATTKPCGVESKAAPAYLTANSVTPGTYQAADTDVIIMKFTITDGPDSPPGWWVQQVDLESNNADDSDVATVRLWADDGDGSFDAGDLEIDSGVFNASGTISFKASNNPGVWNTGVNDTWASSSQAFFVTYDLDTAVTDGDVIDAYIPANGITLYNASSGTYIFPGSTGNSPGQSTIDVIATKVSMRPVATTACLNSEKIIYAYALDAYDNLDTGSTEYVDITMTHTSGANATLINTTSMSAPTFYAGAGGYNRVTGNLVGGIGDVTFIEDHIDTVTLTPTSSLASEVSNTSVGNNVCLSAKNITTGVYPAGQTGVIMLKFTVTNGLAADSIDLQSLRIQNTGTCESSALDGAHLYHVDTSTHVGDFAAFGSGGQVEFATYTFSAYSLAAGTTRDFWVKYNISQTGVTDSTTLDTLIPTDGLVYEITGAPYYLDEQAADSPSYSLIDIDGNTLRLEPNVSKTLLTANCNNCTTAYVADASLLEGETQLAIGGNSDRTVMTVSSLDLASDSVTFTSPATGSYTAGVHYVYNLITNSKKLRLQVEDTFGNICLDDEGDSEPFSVDIESPATIQETTFNIWSCSSSSWATGTQYAGGCANNGFATNTFEYTGCAPQSFIVTPNSTLPKYSGREFTATIDFPGDILSDGIGPVVDDIAFEASITGCISTMFPKIDVISGTDDCSGVQAFRLSCASDSTAFNSVDNWVSIGAATETADVCCNCEGDPRDVGCGFNISNGQICKSNFDISTGNCNDIEGWIDNDVEPDGIQDSGCVANGVNRVFVQFKDKAGNETGLPIATSTIPVVLDTLPPTISSPVSIYSVDKEDYFYGTGDAAYPEAPLNACDANPQGTATATLTDDCLVWFNSVAGEGGGQTARFEVIASDSNALASLNGSSAFSQNPIHSIAPASGPYTFSVDYVIPNGGTDEVIYLSVYDTCDNAQSIQVTMKYDNEEPSLPAISGFATDSSGVSLASNTWYSYPSLYFTWATGSDLPSGTALTDNAGLIQYKYVATTDPTMDYSNLIYATDGNEFYATGPLVSGYYYYAFMSPRDRVGNFASPTFASFTYYYDATSPLNPGVPVNGFASSTDLTAITNGVAYGYANPYFTWSTPADQPLAPLNSSGVAGYYVVFSTDSSATPISYQTAATYTGNPSTCYEPWYLRLYTVDSSTPANSASAVTVFTYTMKGQVVITGNQAGDDTWRNATGTFYDVDFSISCGSLDHMDYTLWSRSGMGAGTGSEVVPWTTLIATATVGGVQSYTADFEIPFHTATDGYNFVTIKAFDQLGNVTVATDVFYIKKDTVSPNNAVSTLAYSDYTAGLSIASGTWYSFPAPYFDWAAGTDLPDDNNAPTPLNSGFGGYYVYFGTGAASAPTYATTTDAFISTSTLTSGYYYYLRQSSYDNVGNSTSATTLFTYYYDANAPDNPATPITAWDSIDHNAALSTGDAETYTAPQFIWAAPSDNPPAPLNSSGVSGYYVAFSTNAYASPTVGSYQATTTYVGTLTSCYEPWYLRVLTQDSAVYPNVASTASTLFAYSQRGVLSVTDNQSGDDSWRNASGTTYDVDFNITCGYIDHVDYSIWSRSGMGSGTGSEVVSWSSLIATATIGGASSYTTDFEVPFHTATEGWNFVSIKVYDPYGYTYVATDAFYIKKDTVAPPIPAVVGVCKKDTAADPCNTLEVQDTWWAHISTPYFEWATSTDLWSGFKQFHYYWGMNAAGDPLTDPDALTTVINGIDQLGEIQMDKPTPIGAYIGNRFYLRMVTEDNVGNLSTATEIFNFIYDPNPPTAPAASGYDDINIVHNITAGSGTLYYSYPDPYFEWSNAGADEVGESGLAAYFATFTTDFNGDPATNALYMVATTTVALCNPLINTATEYCYDSAASGPALVSGNYYYLKILALDKALNRASNTAGGNVSDPVVAFEYWYDASAPDNPTAPITAWDSDGHNINISSGNIYDYTAPQFIWAAPSDNPVAPLNSAGVAGYYVAFSTNQYASPTFASYQATRTYDASAASCYENWYLRVLTQDNSNPPNVASTATTLFTYKRKGQVSLTNNVAGDDTWRNATGTTYDVDFSVSCGYIDHVDYTIWSRSGLGAGTGTEVVPWTNLLATATIGGVANYTTDFEVPFHTATDGYNFVTLRVFDPYGNYSVATDAFYIKKDTVPPDNATTTAAFSDYTAGTSINTATWYGYPAPYFTWAAGTDLPDDNNAPIPLNSGFDSYYVYFGTGAASAPTYSTTTAGFLSTDTLTSGYYYYLRQSNHDVVGNATTATTLFTYYYDTTAPLNPAVPVNAYASPTMITSFNNATNYPYDSVYFTWGSPQDQPLAPLNSSGVYGYYVGFGTDDASTPMYFTTGNDYYASPTVCNATHTFRIRTVDNTTPPNVASSVTAFEYYWQGIPYVTDNQADDVTWYNSAPIGSYDVDFGAQCGSLKSVEYTFWDSADMGSGTGTEQLAWTYLSNPNDLSPTYGLPMYTTNWNIPVADFAAAAEGVNYVSVRIVALANAVENTGYGTDVFTFRKDTTPPNNATSVAAFSDYTAGTSISDSTWYSYPAPYFTWATGTDLPLPLNSGFGDSLVYFGTGAASAPTYSTTTAGFISTSTLTSGYYYYLRQENRDTLGNATSASTLFTYYYDSTAPLNPGNPVNAYASSSMITSFTNATNYAYDSVYFTWATPQDQPLAPLTSSGVSGYYVGFGTDTASTPVYFTTSNNYFASTTECNATHVLRIRTVDSATPANVSTAATVFEYYWQGIPYVTDSQGDDLTWHNAGPIGPYDIDFGAQCGTIKSVEYTFFSGPNGNTGTGTQSLDWTYLSGLSPTYGLPTYTADWSIPVGDFNSAAEGVNFVSFRVTTITGLFGYSTDVFTFRKDTAPPTIPTAGVVDTSNYFWVSPSNGKMYYGLGMAGEEFFAFTGTATDTLSGLATATFSTTYGDTPVDDTTPETWSGSYGITSADAAAATVTVTVYDIAGNSVSTSTQIIQNATLTIDFASMTPPLIPMFPTFVLFDVYYPDGVTPMTSNDENLAYGLYATVTAGVDTSNFMRMYDGAGNPVSVLDDVADVAAEEFVVSLLSYQTGALDTCGGSLSSTNHWCVEYYTGDCVSSTNPHYLEFYNTSFMTNGFYAGISEKTTDGDLGAAVVAPVSDGDAGTFQAHTGPSYVKAYPAGDGLITEDETISNWCYGALCPVSCDITGTDLWCSNDAATITAKPDFFKFENATQDRAFDNVADDSIPAVSQWSWDTTNLRVMISNSNNPSVAATTTYTPNNGSELVCVSLMDSCDQTITTGRWQDETISLTLSNAPNSGKDIAGNNATGYRGFYNVTTPANYTDPDQLTIQGDLLNGLACITVTAESTPSDTPQTPIRIDPTYLGSPALTHTGGTDTAAFVLIRPNAGLASGTAQFAGFSDVYNLYTPSATAPIESIVMEPDFSFDGSKLAYVSRQSDPCGQSDTSLMGATHTNFNLYALTMNGGILSDCRLLTANDSSGYGPDPSSGVTLDNSDLDLDGSYGDRVVYSAMNPGTFTRKLMWVSATGTVGLATGTQFQYSPYDSSPNQTTISSDINIGVSTFTVDPPAISFSTGAQVILANMDMFTFAFDTFEVRNITGYDPNTYEVSIDSPTTILIEAFGATTQGIVQSPVTLSDVGQAIVDESDGADWFDPDWSPDDSVCSNADYRDSLVAIRKPSFSGEDTECSPACAEYGGGGTDVPNIVQIYGAKDANGMYQVDGSTSDLRKLTHFTGDIWPLKPKWSPNCDMIAFLAWDRTNIGPPSETSVYIMNLNSSSPGFATVTLPVTSLTDTGVYPVYSFASSSYSAHTPNWSADGKIVSYAIDKNNTFDLIQMNSGPDDLVANLFTSSDFDSYLEYILDQPPSQDGIIAPQIVGRVSNNEFGLIQCPGNINDVATSCPNSPNFPYVHVGQFYGSQDAFLRQMTLSDKTSITDSGGILFLDGIVTAVFPPNVLASDTVFWNEDPTIGYCGGAVGAGNCPLDPTNEFIVQAGDARDYFPDGTNFSSYIRLIFHYCDNDDDGKIDANTEGVMTATTGGTVAFDYNSLTGQCSINGVATSGGTIDVDTLAVYNWDVAGAQWVKLTGILDKTNKTMSVFSDHFSLYETLGFRNFAPQVLTPLSLTDVHTYPNPFVEGDHPDGIRFSAQGITGAADVNIDIKIYDIRGSFVAQLLNVVPSNFNSVFENNAYTLYHWRTPTNASGHRLASGIYIYYLYARDNNGYEATKTGKFSIVR